MARQIPVQPKPKQPVNRAIATQRAHLARELVEALIIIGLIFVIVHFTIQSFSISDKAMGDALQPNQAVLVNKQAYLLSGPSRGDVVVLTTDPSNPNATVVRRVVGIPGDTIAVSATAIIVNGTPLNESFVKIPPGSAENSTLHAPLKLGSGQYYVLADSRVGTDNCDPHTIQTSDSRCFGPIPENDIIGKAIMVFWPISQFHWVDTHSGDYSNIKNP